MFKNLKASWELEDGIRPAALETFVICDLHIVFPIAICPKRCLSCWDKSGTMPVHQSFPPRTANCALANQDRGNGTGEGSSLPLVPHQIWHPGATFKVLVSFFPVQLQICHIWFGEGDLPLLSQIPHPSHLNLAGLS